jgi:phosphatidate cytidylyltransferase
LFLRNPTMGPLPVLILLGTVIAIDIWAYFFGRRFGGAKIAPAISPSKTWSGLVGAMLGAALVLYFAHGHDWRWAFAGPPVAVVAQAGDFFESWMKRRAGVKDSGRLLPGHGGLFDRVDGLLAVLFALGIGLMVPIVLTLASGGSLLPSPA